MSALQFRKNQNTGEWDVFGPIDALVVGTTVEVTLKSGAERLFQVSSVSRPFDVEGVPHAYAKGGTPVCSMCYDLDAAYISEGHGPVCRECFA
jgi:hypothetical protein